MKINNKKFVEYIAEKKNQCISEERILKEDNRQDEANLCKVRFNVYDIFNTLYTGSITMMDKKTFLDEEEKVKAIYEEFLTRSKRIPASWHESLAKARQFEAGDKAAIEEIKLSTVDEIMNYFAVCCENQSTKGVKILEHGNIKRGVREQIEESKRERELIEEENHHRSHKII